MLKEKLSDYSKRKELSKKATKEVVAILTEQDYSTEEAIAELVEALFELKANAIYEFVCERFEKVPVEQVGLFVESCQKEITPNKFSHAFCLIIGLCKQSKPAEANRILSHLVRNYVLVKKVNKQIYAAFDRAMRYDGSDCFFEKWQGEDNRAKNGYRLFLTEFLKEYAKPDHANKVVQWFAVNEMVIHETEQKVIAKALQQSNGEPTKKKEAADSLSSEQKKGSVDLKKMPLTQLPDEIVERCAQLCESCNALEAENRELKKNEGLVTEKLKSAELSLKQADLAISSLRETIATREVTIENLKKELSDANGKLKEANNVAEELDGKLRNLESAYKHAGEQELGNLKWQIKKRLMSEYSKYVVLKERSPDMDYYDILLDMLDEIFYVLRKNGIDFDKG